MMTLLIWLTEHWLELLNFWTPVDCAVDQIWALSSGDNWASLEFLLVPIFLHGRFFFWGKSWLLRFLALMEIHRTFTNPCEALTNLYSNFASVKDLRVGGWLRCILVSAGGCSEDQCHACLFSPRTRCPDCTSRPTTLPTEKYNLQIHTWW